MSCNVSNPSKSQNLFISRVFSILRWCTTPFLEIASWCDLTLHFNLQFYQIKLQSQYTDTSTVGCWRGVKGGAWANGRRPHRCPGDNKSPEYAESLREENKVWFYAGTFQRQSRISSWADTRRGTQCNSSRWSLWYRGVIVWSKSIVLWCRPFHFSPLTIDKSTIWFKFCGEGIRENFDLQVIFLGYVRYCKDHGSLHFYFTLIITSQVKPVRYNIPAYLSIKWKKKKKLKCFLYTSYQTNA